jgi:hypothetical protein
MIYTTRRGQAFDLEKDFSAPERHILQKLLLWEELAGSVEEFRRRKQEALRKGWGDSGPVRESPHLQSLTRDLEERVAQRLRTQKQEQGD